MLQKLQLLICTFLVTTFVQAQLQPLQPSSGYGSSNYSHQGMKRLNFDKGSTPGGFYLYLLDTPAVQTAPLIIFNHGYTCYNPAVYGEWIRHLVRRGNIVVFARYEIAVLADPAQFTTYSAQAIQSALDTLSAHKEWAQPSPGSFFIFGHSYGGVVSANLATQYIQHGIPKPNGIFLACPGTGNVNSGRLTSYAAMDSSIAIISVAERQDNVVDSVFTLDIFNQTSAVPYSHKNIVFHYPDNHGNPPIGADHLQPCSPDLSFDNGTTNVGIQASLATITDANDFYTYWKLSDALIDCRVNGKGCNVAFGSTQQQKSTGTWSDNTPIIPLEIRPSNAITGTDQALSGEIEIYPNPFSDQLQIKQSGSDPIINYALINIEGNLLASGKFNMQSNIYTGNLPSGMYTLQLNDGKSIKTYKVIKK